MGSRCGQVPDGGENCKVHRGSNVRKHIEPLDGAKVVIRSSTIDNRRMKWVRVNRREAVPFRNGYTE